MCSLVPWDHQNAKFSYFRAGLLTFFIIDNRQRFWRVGANCLLYRLKYLSGFLYFARCSYVITFIELHCLMRVLMDKTMWFVVQKPLIRSSLSCNFLHCKILRYGTHGPMYDFTSTIILRYIYAFSSYKHHYHFTKQFNGQCVNSLLIMCI